MPTSLATSTTGSGGLAQSSAQRARLRVESPAGQEQVRQPQRQAIDEHRTLAALPRRQWPARARAAFRPCARTGRGAPDARRCARPSRRRPASAVAQVGAARGGVFDEPLGIAALARAGAAQHQGDRRVDTVGPRRVIGIGPSSSARGIVPVRAMRRSPGSGSSPAAPSQPGLPQPVAVAADSPLTVAGAAPVSHRTSLSHRKNHASTRRLTAPCCALDVSPRRVGGIK